MPATERNKYCIEMIEMKLEFNTQTLYSIVDPTLFPPNFQHGSVSSVIVRVHVVVVTS